MTLTTTKREARETILAEFVDAPAEIVEYVEHLAERINAGPRGTITFYDDYLDLWIKATA